MHISYVYGIWHTGVLVVPHVHAEALLGALAGRGAGSAQVVPRLGHLEKRGPHIYAHTYMFTCTCLQEAIGHARAQHAHTLCAHTQGGT